MDDGELWSFFRRVLEQGRAIAMDEAAGKYPTYEHLSARLDEAARERVEQYRQECADADDTGTAASAPARHVTFSEGPTSVGPRPPRKPPLPESTAAPASECPPPLAQEMFYDDLAFVERQQAAAPQCDDPWCVSCQARRERLDLVEAQHEDTGRMWFGSRQDLPHRYRVIRPSDQPAAQTAAKPQPVICDGDVVNVTGFGPSIPDGEYIARAAAATSGGVSAFMLERRSDQPGTNPR